MIELIANSGIQFYKFDLKIDPNKDVIKTMGFWEKLDMEEQRVKLEHATYLSEEDFWVSRKELAIEGYLNEDGSIAENINYKLLNILKEKIDFFKVNDIETPLECYENEWLPFPYFINNEFGPTNWCRIKLIPKESQHRRVKEFKVVLAFDTKTTEDREQRHTPLSNIEFTNFTLCDDIDRLLNYCDKKHSEEWIMHYLAQIIDSKVQKGITNKIRIDDGDDDGNYFELDYIGYYIYLVKYLHTLEVCPPVSLLTDKVTRPIDVDLVLDIGNSNTFGVLFEAPHQQDAFNFNSVKRLKLQDFTQVEKEYDESFSMRLAFHKCDFGEMGNKDEKFHWPSFVRVGKEAKRLIYDAHNAVAINGNEIVTNHSSPKRYLWDTDKSDIQWEIILIGEDIKDNDDVDTSIYLQGITEQFTKDGSFTKSVDFGTQNQYSRKSLMTFVFIELLSHALVQINSPDFRDFHGHSSTPRRLRRVVITCPTAMVQEEQITLRQCAEEATIVLQRYHTNTYREEYKSENHQDKIEIIPSVRDLRRKIKDFSSRRDWIYDEATCCQLVFLYAEISKRYLNNSKQYFDLYGKYRSDLNEDYNKKSLTVGSIDIGAGTTDLMINAYQYEDDGTAVLTPIPLYWESFTYAGDDLLKEIVREVIIEGNIQDEKYRGCTGVIMNEARQKGITGITSKLNKFFGTDSANISFKGKQIRRKFNTQISVPIAECYMEHARLGEDDKIFTYDDFFKDYQPNQELLDYFEEHFRFKFQDIRWKLSAQRIYDIVERFFEPFIKQLSVLLHTMKCDFVLLAGRPTSINKIGELFLKFYPVSPDKIITLNNYRVGRWYPFQDGRGYFTNQKSIVAVGAAISMTGGSLDKLQGFRLNMDYVKKRLVSTAQYMGVYNRVGQRISNIFLTPDQNRDKFRVASLPLMIGFKRLPAKSYRGRMIYLLEFNDEKIAERRASHYPDLNPEQLEREVDDYKIKLKNRMPFTVKISRDYRDDRENIHIDSIVDAKREDISTKLFALKLKTLDEDKGYWLDTGQFVLGI